MNINTKPKHTKRKTFLSTGLSFAAIVFLIVGIQSCEKKSSNDFLFTALDPIDITDTSAILRGLIPNYPELVHDAVATTFRYSATKSDIESGGGTAVKADQVPGSCSKPISNLTPYTTYYFIIQTEFNGEKHLSEIKNFTTTGPIQVTTNAVNTIAQTSAIAGGNLVTDGGTPITEKGVCYSTYPNPTTTDIKVVVPGTTTGSFDANLTGLTPGTQYFVRAYAFNSKGISYGTEVAFTTTTTPGNDNANFLGTYTMTGNDTFTVNTNDIVITANGTSGIVIGNFGNYSPSIDVDATVSAAQVMTIASQTKGGAYTVSAGTGTISADFKTITVHYTIDAFGYISNRYQIYTRK